MSDASRVHNRSYRNSALGGDGAPKVGVLCISTVLNRDMPSVEMRAWPVPATGQAHIFIVCLAGQQARKMLTLLAIPLAILYECWTDQLLGDTATIAVVLLSTISDRGAARIAKISPIVVLTLFSAADPTHFRRFSSRSCAFVRPSGRTRPHCALWAASVARIDRKPSRQAALLPARAFPQYRARFALHTGVLHDYDPPMEHIDRSNHPSHPDRPSLRGELFPLFCASPQALTARKRMKQGESDDAMPGADLPRRMNDGIRSNYKIHDLSRALAPVGLCLLPQLAGSLLRGGLANCGGWRCQLPSLNKIPASEQRPVSSRRFL